MALAEEAVAIHRETGNRMSEFACLACLGAAWRELDSIDRALSYAQRALDVARELDNPVREGFALLEFGRAHALLDQPEEALASFHEAAALHRSIGDHVREAESFEGAGGVYRSLGRLVEAAQFLRQAVGGYRRHGARWNLAVCLDRLATVVSRNGETEAARGHWREALEALSDLADPRAEHLRETVTGHLGDATG